jgi:DNA polymerase
MIVLSVHDEIVAEVPEEFGSKEEFEEITCRLPARAKGFPMKAKGWRAKLFRNSERHKQPILPAASFRPKHR